MSDNINLNEVNEEFLDTNSTAADAVFEDGKFLNTKDYLDEINTDDEDFLNPGEASEGPDEMEYHDYNFEDIFNLNNDNSSELPFDNNKESVVDLEEERHNVEPVEAVKSTDDFDADDEEVVTRLDFNNLDDGVPAEVQVNDMNSELKLDEIEDEKIEPQVIEEELGKEKKVDIPVFDSIFDSVYENVENANNFVDTLIERKKNIDEKQSLLDKSIEELEKDQKDFKEYQKEETDRINKERKELEKEQFDFKKYKQIEEDRIAKELKKNNDLKEENDKNLKSLKEEKEIFDNYKKEEAKKLENEKQLLEKSLQELEDNKKEFLDYKSDLEEKLKEEKQEFLDYKKEEEKRIQEESNDLALKCAKFKEIVAKFNEGFQQLPEEK